jgi:predicted HAD superfamily phosphohydrolase YqeG
MAIRRCPVLTVADDPVAEALALDPVALIVDLEPLILHWSAPEEHLPGALAALRERIPDGVSVTVVTNSRRQLISGEELAVGFIRRARKPFSTWGLPRGDRVVVIGDTDLTDGILALRLGARYVRVMVRERPPWARVQSVLAIPLAPMLFRSLNEPAAFS